MAINRQCFVVEQFHIIFLRLNNLMKARNYIGRFYILMTVVNQLCDFCHIGKRDMP